MKTIDRKKGASYQGDLFIIPIENIPNNIVEAQPDGDNHVVAHSETGHHHVVSTKLAKFYAATMMMSYLRVISESVELQHLRPNDKHETLVLPKGDYQLLRQREGSPDGWRQVMD